MSNHHYIDIYLIQFIFQTDSEGSARMDHMDVKAGRLGVFKCAAILGILLLLGVL